MKLHKEIIGFIMAFILAHLVSMYIVGGFNNQTLTSKIISTIIGCIIGFAVALFINEEKEKQK
jgi:uncharacterized membrane protein